MLHCETVGELRAALADLPDGAPLLVEYDGGCAGSGSVAVVGVAADRPDWPSGPRNGDAWLSIDYDLEDCDNVVSVSHRCSVCELTVKTYTIRDSGRVVQDELSGGLMPGHVRGNAANGLCPGFGQPPRAEGGV